MQVDFLEYSVEVHGESK